MKRCLAAAAATRRSGKNSAYGARGGEIFASATACQRMKRKSAMKKSEA